MHTLIQELTLQGGVPRDALQRCQEQIEAISGDLLGLVEQAANGALPEEDRDRALLGLYLLAWARDRRAFPLLLRLLRLPTDDMEERLGDGFSDYLPKLIISSFDGSADTLFAFACDRAVDQYVRAQVFAAIAFLTWDGRIDAEATRNFLQRIDDSRPLPKGDYGWCGWSEVVELLGWHELAPRVARAYRDGRLESWGNDVVRFNQEVARSRHAAPGDPARFEAEDLGYVTDIVNDLAWFEPDEAEPDTDDAPLTDETPERPAAPEPSRSDRWGAPAHNPLRHVGRNDPCPCGSGKKFKRCCGAGAG